MNENKTPKVFEPGDFLTYDNKPGSFAIFEGIEQPSNTTTRKFSVLASYDPSKYREHEDGAWRSSPFIEVATRDTRCSQLVENACESFWWRVCTEAEKEKAIDILQQYGYYWNEDLLSIISKDTGEIIRTVAKPTLEYHGEIVKPITKKIKEFIQNLCFEGIKKKYSYSQTCYHGCWDGYWDEEW